MSKQERGRGRSRGGYGQVRGRNDVNPQSHQHSQDFSNFDPHPGSNYYPPQTSTPQSSSINYPAQSSSGIHSGSNYYPPQSSSGIHSGSNYYPPQSSSGINSNYPHSNISANPFPPQSIISVSVIHSPQPPPPQPPQPPPPQPPLREYYSDRSPYQTPTSFFQPGDAAQSKYDNYLHKSMRPDPYSRDDGSIQHQQFKQYNHNRDDLAHSGDYLHQSQSRGLNEHSNTRELHSHYTRQQSYSGQQHDHYEGQQVYGGPQQGHDIRRTQKIIHNPQKQGHHIQEEIGLKQKQGQLTNKKYGHQKKHNPQMNQRYISRDHSTPPHEPPPSYESLSFNSTNELREEIPFSPRLKQTEVNAENTFREGKLQKRYKHSSKNLQPRPFSADRNASGDRDSYQRHQFDQHYHQGLLSENVSSKPGQSSQTSRGLPKSSSRERWYHKQKSSFHKGDNPHTLEGIIPAHKDIQVTERLEAKQGIKYKSSAEVTHNKDKSGILVGEKVISSNTGGRERTKGRGNIRGKSKQNDRTFLRMSDLSIQNNFDKSTAFDNSESTATDNLLNVDNQVKSGDSAEVNNQESTPAQKNKSRTRKNKRHEKMLHANHGQELEEQTRMPLCHITKASLQILTPFKDATSLKEAVELHADKLVTEQLQFVDDSIICSEKRSVCTVVIKAKNRSTGRHAVTNLCDRLRRSLNTKVFIDISSDIQENSLEDEKSLSQTSTAGNSQMLTELELDADVTEDEKRGIKSYRMLPMENEPAEDNEASEKGNKGLQDKKDSNDAENENSESTDEENSDCTDDGNTKNIDVESDENSFEDNSQYSDENNEDLDGSSDEESTEDLGEESSEDLDEDSAEDLGEESTEDLDDEKPEGLNDENTDDLDEGVAESVDEEKKAEFDKESLKDLDERNSEDLNKRITGMQIPTKVSVVVDKVFPTKTDFVQLLTRIIGDKMSQLELMPDSIVTATSTTLCELIVTDKLTARNIVKIVNSSKLEGVQVRCFTVSEG